jgi:putative membrane protein
MKSTIALVGFAFISCTALATAQAPSQAPPTPPAGQAPARGGGQASPPPVGQTSTPPAGKSSAQPVGESAKTDSGFIKKAAMGGMAEVELGQLASMKASDDKVKSFGQKMVTDHGKANDELKMLAASKHIDLPATLDSKHQATHARLSKLSGSAFDRAYVSDMLADHKKDVAEFKHQSTSASDPDVKAFASKTLPTLHEHLKMIEDISKDLHVTATSGSTK